MSNTRSGADFVDDALREISAPQRELIATLRNMEASFKQEREFILQHHPEEDVGEFPSLEDIETMNFRDLDIRKVFCGLAVRSVERRASEVQAELDEADRKQREQDLTELEKLKRAVYDLAARVTKLEGGQPGRLPSSARVTRDHIPQLLGQPGGMGRHPAAGPIGGGAQLLQRAAEGSAPASALSTMEQGFTRRQHPLDVIGSSGRRG